MWLKCGHNDNSSSSGSPYPPYVRETTHPVWADLWARKLLPVLTINGGLHYICPLRRAARLKGAMARRRSISLIFSVIKLPMKVGGLRLRRLSGSPEGGAAMVPGLFEK